VGTLFCAACQLYQSIKWSWLFDSPKEKPSGFQEEQLRPTQATLKYTPLLFSPGLPGSLQVAGFLHMPGY
jgi:hypothetical protein